MIKSKVSDVKRERKKSLFLREISTIIQDLVAKEAAISQVYVSHIDISQNSGICYVYFSAFQEPGEEIFQKILPILKLYKPSMRKTFASRIQMRYTPELVFVYDKAKEKERRINQLLDRVQEDFSEDEQD